MSATPPAPYFHPRDPSQEQRIAVDALRQFLLKALVKKSMFQFDAETVVARLIDADLQGRSAYGVRSLPRILDAMDAGDVDPRARILTEVETPAIAVICGSTAVGAVAATKGMQVAIDKARGVGIGAVTVHHSQPLGAACTYAQLAAQEGLIGFCTSSSGGAAVAGPGTSTPITADHPWSWAFPTEDGPPIVVDTTCGMLSRADIELLNLYGLPIPPGVAVDETGTPTSDSTHAKTLLPAAGSHGFGLGLVASLLSGILAGGKLPLNKTRSPSAENSEHFLLALDISQFTDAERFKTRSRELRQVIHALPPKDDGQPVEVPGERSVQEAAECQEQGIPIHVKDIEELARRASQLKIEHPF